jgi:RNA polymerase sigma-32 factor
MARDRQKKPRAGRTVARDPARPIHCDEPEAIETEAVPVDVSGELPDADAADAPIPLSDDDSGRAVAASTLAKPEADESEGGRGSLVPFDPISQYMKEIRQFPLLTREEESEIAHRYVKYQDPADAYRLVTANLRLVVKIANEFARASRNLLDLIQEGNVGLMEAVKNFDPYRGIRFPSYAVWWVRAYIYRYLINNWRLVKIGTTQAQRKLFFNLRKETERLEAEGFSPQPKLLAQRMGVRESDVREMQERMAQSEISLDHPAGLEEGMSLADTLADTDPNPEETAARVEWRDFAREKVEQFAATLKDKELDIFRTRLMTEDPPTLQVVGERLNLSRERVRQIEARLKQRLREFVDRQAADLDQART